MSLEELKSRDYDGGLPQEVCNAVYDTIVKNAYKSCFIVCEDANLRDWITESRAKAQFSDTASSLRSFVGLVFWARDAQNGDIEILCGKIKRGGQIAFYGSYEAPLRAFFNRQANWDKWSTIEIALGDGLFVARRL